MLGRSPSVIRGGIKRNAGADGCYRGGEAGRMAARRRARPKERALEADPVLRARAWPGLRGVRAPLDQRAPQGPERVAGVGRHVLAPQQPVSARSATRRLRTWIHTPSRGRNFVGARDRAALTALGAQEDPRRRVVSPRVVGMRLTGRAP